MARKLVDVLEEQGMSLNLQAGGEAPKEMVDREVKEGATERAAKLKDIYLQTLSSVTCEFPYWYNRVFQANEGDIMEVRRGRALKAGFEHLTPSIYPGELLVGAKTQYYRGSFPMPWLSEGFFMAKEDELYQAALASGSASADQVSAYGAGGGNVTESFGNVVSIAGKYGIRKDEVRVLTKLAREWVGKSVDDVGHRYEQMVPEYPIKEAVMRSLICMFDSGYTLPQGREVINYFYPLQYGYDGLIKMCEEGIAETAGRPDGDGIIGMSRLYFYEAVKLVLEGIQTWHLHYADEAKRLAATEKNAKQKKEYEEIAEIMEHIAHKQPRNFREALQMIYMVHMASVNEDAISGMSPGRIGQVLWPWFEQDMEAGRITETEVLDF